ncbi:aminotransferase class V-fold PLP-dependent enzyme [Kineobactrum salinum]|uniref:Aminotransferase class V-fold PLP-dependent enzyme n=1 Tax=Kineobactrum salinum TaxID=2708301 RepID=A0A6C0U0P5_9GAMM|nr:aminotransferase class V-fold PLP-dependent enzyme [Kineobactrum salinum]QIB64547.1 aminotransferase class V-fold PLP-dependent enzyme [Kineobactrum salinum]
MSYESNDPAYFLYHSIGQFPGKAQLTAKVLADYADIWSALDDAQWPRVLHLRQQFLDVWHQIIGAPEGTLTAAENVTTALYSVLGGLPTKYRRGRFLIAADCFPSLHFLLAGMAERHGFILDTVEPRPGEYWVRDEDMLERWGEDVGIALLTQVTSVSSHRCDLHRLLEQGRAMGTIVGVDITQAVGLLPYDVVDCGADFTISTSLKWLCGTSGAGILQVRPGLLEECRPELRGWFSQDNIFSWDLNNFRFAPDARRFDHGTPSVVGSIASLPALQWISAQDPEQLLAHNRQLGEAIIVGADSMGLKVATPRHPAHRGGSVMLELPAGIDGALLIDELRTRGIFADCRGRILRLSPGNMTRQSDVDKLLEALSSLVCAA